MGLSFREKLRSSAWWPHTQPHHNPYIGGYRDATSHTTPSITITPTTTHSTANTQLSASNTSTTQSPSRNSSISGRRPSTTSTTSLVSTSEKSKRSSTDRSRSKSRKRDILWKDGLWNAADPAAGGPRGKVVKARSCSVGALHPSVAEEMMKEDGWGRR